MGTEALKNLVLPGVGRITILDPVCNVTEEMRGSNFFLNGNHHEGGGEQYRGKEVLNLLLEMNEQVSGQFDSTVRLKYVLVLHSFLLVI